MKIGISIKLDVTKIDKNRIFQGAKGKYIDLTTFIDTENPSTWGDHGFISQTVTKAEREQGIKTPILGNCKVFFGLNQQQGYQQNQGQQNMGYQPQPQNQNQGYQPPQQGYQQQQSYQPAPQQQDQNQNNQPYSKDDIPF